MALVVANVPWISRRRLTGLQLESQEENSEEGDGKSSLKQGSKLQELFQDLPEQIIVAKRIESDVVSVGKKTSFAAGMSQRSNAGTVLKNGENVDELGEGDEIMVKCAKLVRDFIRNSKCGFISEVPYMVGMTKWVSFTFTCKLPFAEECLKRLGTLGIGTRGGVGIVNVISLHLQKVATLPIPVDESQPLQTPPNTPPSPNSQASIAERVGRTISDDEKPEDGDHIQKTSSSENEEDGVTAQFSKSDLDTTASNYHEENHVVDVEDQMHVEESVNGFEGLASKFRDTVKSRIAVDTVVDLVNDAAVFSFDYVMLVIVASILACIGLVTGNVVIIVASMLVSPLMGPILAVTFGISLSDRAMIQHGLFSELVGLFVCALVGFIGGLCAAPVVGLEWPTTEMWSRATGSSVYVGISIAIPSGIGVALSVLGNNTSSLVGVAISASLLPPAVNTGVLLAMAALSETPYIDWEAANKLYDGEETINVTAVLQGAGWSLLLTLANIVCIWISGVLMFRIKEVTPIEGKSDFWTTHVPNLRTLNNTVIKKGDKEAEAVREALRKELDAFHGANKVNHGRFDHYDDLAALNTHSHSHEKKSPQVSVMDEGFFTAPEGNKNGSKDEVDLRRRNKHTSP